MLMHVHIDCIEILEVLGEMGGLEGGGWGGEGIIDILIDDHGEGSI